MPPHGDGNSIFLSSLIFYQTIRQNARENDVKMLKFCMKYQVPVVMDSDAHFDTHIAEFDAARGLLEELNFPEELVVNHSVNALRGYINALK